MSYNSKLCLADATPLFNSKTFRGFDWGSDLKQQPQLECGYNHMQNETNCTLKNGDLKFLGVDLKNYYYSVNWENKFDYVAMQIKDRQEWEKLKDNLAKELGDQYIGNLAGGYIVYTWQKDNLEIILRDNNPELSGEKTYLFLEIQNKKFYLSRPYLRWSGLSRPVFKNFKIENFLSIQGGLVRLLD